MEKGEMRWWEEGFIKAAGLSPAHSEYVNVSDTGKNTAKEKWEEERERKWKGTAWQSEWVSKWESKKESKRARERERALWIVSGLRHSVNRRCFCMQLVDCSAERNCALLCFPHLPPLPAYQHQPSAASSSWLGKHTESKGMNETCEPQGTEAASGMSCWDEKEYCHTRKQWTRLTSLIFLFSSADIEMKTTRLDGFEPCKSVICHFSFNSFSLLLLFILFFFIFFF